MWADLIEKMKERGKEEGKEDSEVTFPFYIFHFPKPPVSAHVGRK